MFVCIKGDSSAVQVPVAASSGILKGDLLVKDTTNKVVKLASATTSAVDTFGVAAEDAGSAAGYLRVVPIRDGQEWEWDTTSNTASTQLMITHLLTDDDHVNNTTSDANSAYTTVLAYANVGAAADKKQRGIILKGVKTA